MSPLPKLNNMPKYSVTVPSMNKEVTIRPFIVKEEKIMLIAMESQDPKQIAQAILDTVKSCILDEEIDTRLLTSYDVEYMFLKIRAKSAGETAKLLLKCEHCEKENEVSINIDDIKMDIKEGWTNDNVIKITDDINVEMKHPSFVSLASSSEVLDTSPTRQIFGLLKESVVSVNTEEERIDMRDVKFEEFEEFIESMTGEQFTKIREYIMTIPKLQHNVKFDCKECSKETNINLEGLQSFL